MLIKFINLMHEKLVSIIFNENRDNKNDTLLSKLNIKNIIFLILILYNIIQFSTPLILTMKKLNLILEKWILNIYYSLENNNDDFFKGENNNDDFFKGEHTVEDLAL